MSPPWKPEEDETLKRLRMEGLSVDDVAIALGRAYRAVVDRTRYLRAKTPEFDPPRIYNRPCAHRNRKPNPAGPTGRKCLCCGKQFPSEHKCNRICMQCKESDVFGSAPNIEGSSGRRALGGAPKTLNGTGFQMGGEGGK